jgi:hypothetical protein
MSDNQWQIIYDIDNLALHFKSLGGGYLNTKSVSLNYFDLSCSRPVMAFDIESTQSGNINTQFTPFDYDQNLSLIQSSFAQMPPLPFPDIANIMAEFPETFNCLIVP